MQVTAKRSDLEQWFKVFRPFWAALEDLVDNTGSVIPEGDEWPAALEKVRRATWDLVAYPARDRRKVEAKERAAAALLNWAGRTGVFFEECASVVLASIGQTIEPWASETASEPPVKATWPEAVAFWAAVAFADPARAAPLRADFDQWESIGRTALDAMTASPLTLTHLGEKAQIAAWIGAGKLHCSAAAAGDVVVVAEFPGAFERIYALAPDAFVKALADERDVEELSKEVGRSGIRGLDATHFIRVMIGLSFLEWRSALWSDFIRLRSYGFDLGQPRTRSRRKSRGASLKPGPRGSSGRR